MQNMTHILMTPYVVSAEGRTSERELSSSVLLYWFVLPSPIASLDF